MHLSPNRSRVLRADLAGLGRAAERAQEGEGFMGGDFCMLPACG